MRRAYFFEVHEVQWGFLDAIRGHEGTRQEISAALGLTVFRLSRILHEWELAPPDLLWALGLRSVRGLSQEVIGYVGFEATIPWHNLWKDREPVLSRRAAALRAMAPPRAP